MGVLKLLVVYLFFVFAAGQLPSQDILALLEFKKSIKHDPTGYVLSSWNDEAIDFNGCPSTWNGIVCNGANVAGVVLDNLSLVAEADLSVFANLTMLVKLSMANNSITGEIPENVADFRSLEFLELSDNLFSSSLPLGIGKLESLKNLSLAGNNFSGSIPDSISGLTLVQSLDLSRNCFSGPLPASLTKLNNLVYLNLSMNRLSKNIPRGLELITSLKVLDLHGNGLDGDLYSQLLFFSNLTYVDLSENSLVSPSTDRQKFLPGVSQSIKYLNLSSNLLTGSLVSEGEMQIFENLKMLDLSYNHLTGELPGFNFVYDLEVLKLGNNLFSGAVPGSLLEGDSGVLTELDLSGNNLSGIALDKLTVSFSLLELSLLTISRNALIPGTINVITSTNLRVLNLSSNVLTGELPLLSGGCAVVDLSNNQFEGNLTRIIRWGNIEFLDLSYNRLTGAIPEEMPQFLRLNHLNLSHNSLKGSLPKVLTQYPKLRLLDLSDNQLNGTLLADLLGVSTLEELYLGKNLFSGTLDFSALTSAEPGLRVLVISHNQFRGCFPDEVGSLSSLEGLDLAVNNFSCSLPESMANLSSLVSLDLSENHFTGTIPNNLSNSLLSFNASYNDLSGEVPDNLRKFPRSSFYPGNKDLQLPGGPPGPGNSPSRQSNKKPLRTVVITVVVVSCVLTLLILVVLAIFILWSRRRSRGQSKEIIASKEARRRSAPNPSAVSAGAESGGPLVVSTEDLLAVCKRSTSDEISPDEKQAATTGFSASKKSNVSWSPEPGDSVTAEHLTRLDERSSDRLVGELHFLDDAIALTPEELSRAPAEVLGRSSHGTSYRATLHDGQFLTVKWLREGVAKQRKEFAKEAQKFANIRHPNVVCLRGYYWGPTQHEKLILSDYISPGSLASFLYDRPGRNVPPLTWSQRLKIAVDIARGLNYLHFDRAVPHGNLKAANVLLDGSDLNARISDYCLHRLMTQAGTMEQIVDAGVLGYRAPELAASKKPLPSFKSDVYAFGVIMLELLTGRCAGDVISGEEGGVDLMDWVRLRVAEGRGSECFDSALQPELGNAAADKGMKEVLGIALRCIRTVSERPGIKTIYEDLSSI